MRSQRQRPCTERSAEDNSLGRENTLLPSWKNCIGCQWNSELITISRPLLTNATRVRRQNTCRNSFPDTFMHDPFSHHRNHAYWFQVLLKNSLKAVWFPSFFQLCFPALDCSTTNSQGSRQGGVSQTSENTCSVNDFVPCVFFFFLFMTFSLSPPPPPPPLFEHSS